jgi:DNA-binding winged helix-turn-helix (wHTH) protein/WD40 repeat protein
MAETEPHLRHLRFGIFEVDLRSGELRKAGVKLKLGGQPFQLLTALLERPGEVVTREELQKRLWPDTFVDVDHNLNTAINKIREVLGDSADSPRYVETLPRRGYRFIATVIGDAVPANQLAEQIVPVKPQLRRRPFYYALATAGLAAVIVGSLILWRANFRTPGAPKVLRFTKLTSDGQAKIGPIVTDGSRIYFNELLPGPRNLVVQVSVKGGETIPLSIPLTLPAVLDVSKDGTEFLVASNVLANQVGIEPIPLWMQPVAGGSPQRVGGILVADARFGPDAATIVYSDGHSINSVGTDGSSPRKLLSMEGRPSGFGSAPFAFRFSPDGRVFRFTQYDGELDRFSVAYASRFSSIMQATADGRNLRKMFPGCCGEWTTDGQFFIFQNRTNFEFDLWAFREPRRFPGSQKMDEPVQLTSGPLDFEFPLPSKDGKEIFAIGTSRRAEVVRYDSHSGAFVPYLSGISAEGLSFSRDGQWVTYTSYPEGTLWRSRVDGSQRTQLTFPPLRVFWPRWSPDGKQIAFSATLPNATLNAYLISSEGGNAQQILPSDQIQMDVNWSPDGNSLIFGSLPFRNAPIYTIDLSTKRVSPLPGSTGFFSPHWSPDGRHISAITMANRTLMLFDVSSQKWTEAFGSAMGWENWSHDGKYIYFLDHHDPAQGFGYRVVRLRLSDRKTESIVDIKNIGRLTTGMFASSFGLAPDDSPLFARDISTQEIYALELQRP